jgi:clan AA aspartic protease
MEEPMGFVETEITLINARDLLNAERGFISMDKVRKETVMAVVDTGTMRLFITEELYQKLGLDHFRDIIDILADGRKLRYKLSSSVDVQWKNRSTLVEAVVKPGIERVVLGVIPLTGLDLMVDPCNHTLVGVHGDEVVCKAY